MISHVISAPIIAVSMDERLDGLMKEISTGEELQLHAMDQRFLFHAMDQRFPFHAMDQRFLFHTTEKALGRKISNALEEADSGKEEIRMQILRQVRRNRKEIIRMGTFFTHVSCDRPGRKPRRSCASQ